MTRQIFKKIREGDSCTESWFVFKNYKGVKFLRRSYEFAFSFPWKQIEMVIFRINVTLYRVSWLPRIKLEAFKS